MFGGEGPSFRRDKQERTPGYNLQREPKHDAQYTLNKEPSQLDKLQSKRRFWGWTLVVSSLINAGLFYSNPEHIYNITNVLHHKENAAIVLIQIASILIPFNIWDNTGFKIRDLRISLKNIQ